MALWCRNFPTVTVPRASSPKAVTFVIPYYENPEFLRRQLQIWAGTYPADLRALLRVIVVDDGSPVPAAIPAGLPFDVRLFRIEVDVRWNWLAARNIGAHHAETKWLLMTDIDHVVPEATLRSIVDGHHDQDVVYAFTRFEWTSEPAAPHSASFLMTKKMFWKIGGYDEALSGHYGTDGEYRRRLAEHARIQILTDALIRYEFVADSSTTRYLRKQPQDAAVSRMVAARRLGWKPKTLSFPYHEVPITKEAACLVQ